jgi:hypothetical protein
MFPEIFIQLVGIKRDADKAVPETHRRFRFQNNLIYADKSFYCRIILALQD